MEDVDVFVIAGGKCGSSTLKQTFLNLDLNTIKSHNPTCFKNQFGFTGFFETIKKSSKKTPLIIVDAYRTPIERKISSFFHNGEKKIDNFLTMSTKDQIDLFNKDYLYRIEEQHIINEIYRRIPIPRTKSYEFKKKYLHQHYKNLIIIKLHYDDIKNWGERLSTIFKRPIEIIKDNVSNNKPYYDKYQLFLKEYKVPKKYLLEHLSNDIEFKKFQTGPQQKQYIDKWLKKCSE